MLYISIVSVPPPPSPLQQVVVVPGEEHGDEGEQSTIPPGSDHCLSYRVPSVGHHRVSYMGLACVLQMFLSV